MAKSIRDLVGASEAEDFTDLADRKLLSIEDYGYALKGTSDPLSEHAKIVPDPHGDRAAYYGKTRRMTVSAFIQETQSEWGHVATTDKRSSTRQFSGAPIVMSGLGDYAKQMDEFNKQVLGLEEPSTAINISNGKDVEYVEVDDD